MSGDTHILITGEQVIDEGFVTQNTQNISQQMNDVVVSNASEELVACPTCQGAGKITRGHFEAFQWPNPLHTKLLGYEINTNVPVDPDIYKKIRKEMEDRKISQEVFASVAFGRSQGLLSEMMRKAEQGIKENRSARGNLAIIQEFLAKPLKERLKLYRSNMMESNRKRRIRREYYGQKVPLHKQKSVISSHARAVMLEYYNKISLIPDSAGIQVMSDVLNLDKDSIQRFFKLERKRSKREAAEEYQEAEAAVNDIEGDDDKLEDVPDMDTESPAAECEDIE